MNQKTKVRLCAEFMVKCLRDGWKRSQLDELERIWWDGEAWRYTAEYRRTLLTVNARAGLTNAELKRGVVPKR